MGIIGLIIYVDFTNNDSLHCRSTFTDSKIIKCRSTFFAYFETAINDTKVQERLLIVCIYIGQTRIAVSYIKKRLTRNHITSIINECGINAIKNRFRILLGNVTLTEAVWKITYETCFLSFNKR